MDENIVAKWEWVIGTYTGEMGKYIKGLADSGIGYYVRSERGKSVASYQNEVAFRRIIDGPRPENLIPATAEQCKRLNDLYNQRHHIREDKPVNHQNSATHIADTFNKYSKPSST